MAKIYSVKVTNSSKISQSIKIANPGKGEAVIIRAESGDKFQLIEEQSANSPHKVFVKRVEDNLYVLFEEGNIQKPDLIIENSTVGNASKTKVAICYMKNIANSSLVSSVTFALSTRNCNTLLINRLFL